MKAEDCEHHWHLTSTTWPNGSMGHRLKKFTCCHCGQHREERVPPPQPIDWSYTDDGCGPYKPDPRPYWRSGSAS